MKPHRRLPLVAATLLCPCVQAANLLQNPNFDADAHGWSGLGSAGSFSPDAAHGSPAAGSASVSASGNMDSTFGIVQCVAIAGNDPITYGARARQGAGSGSTGIFVLLRTFQGAGCTGSILQTQIATSGGTVPGIPAGQDYTVYLGTTTAAPTALSAQLIGNLQINTDGSSIQVWFDSMLLDDGDVVFRNGFE